MKIIKTLLLLSLAAMARAEDFPPLSSVVRDDFATNELWDDGKAEVAVYDSERIVYGKTRKFTSQLITVSEPFNKEHYTKAEFPYGQTPLLPVIKQNYTAVIPTDKYDYHYMSSLFVDQTDFDKTVKLSISSHDWCGLTAKQFQLWKNPAAELYQSYWEDEGTGERAVAAGKDDYFEEELFLVLRGLEFKEGLRANLTLFPSQITNRAPEPRSSPATLQVDSHPRGWDVTVDVADGRTMKYIFSEEYPCGLLDFEHSDGRTMTLRSLERYAYWTRN